MKPERIQNPTLPVVLSGLRSNTSQGKQSCEPQRHNFFVKARNALAAVRG